MSGFTEPLAFAGTDVFRGGRLRALVVDGERVDELVGARRLIELQRGFVYDCPRIKRPIQVPAGFRCDLGSIPGFARGFLSPDDPWAQAFVLHDWLYRHGAALGVSRQMADLILWDALGLPFRAYREGSEETFRIVCPSAYRAAIYYSVRLGGGVAYGAAARALSSLAES